MAARTRKIRHDDETRAKIQTSQIINRLSGHVFGKVELTNSQVRAGLGLLAKTLPDLTSVELSGGTTVHVISPKPMTDEEMVEAHGVERAEIRH